MAVTAKFQADFSSFSDAVEKSKVELKSFEQSSGKVETQLNRMTNSFAGTNVIQQATLMAEAVERVGGTSKLTEKEMARVSATVGEAAAKMKAMGIEVPPGFQKIADQTKGIGTASSATSSVLSGLAAQLAGMFTIGAVVAFGRQVLQAGDNIQKMADQTSLSIEEVQRLEHVAGQSGTSIQSLVGAVQNLQQRLGDENTGAAGAMKKLGIESEAFNRLGTYDQMLVLAEAIKAVKDPTEQSSLAAAIFGRTWKEILPAIKAGMREVGDQAPIMADATVKALDRMGDAFTRAKAQATAWFGSAIGAIEETAFKLGMFGRTLDSTDDDLMNLNAAFIKLPPTITDFGMSLKNSTMSVSELEAAQRQLDHQLAASIELHKAEAEALKASEAAAQKLIDAELRLIRVYRDEVTSIQDRLFGNDLIERAKRYADAIVDVEGVARLNNRAQEEMRDVMFKAIEAMVQQGLGADALVQKFGELGFAARGAGEVGQAAMKVLAEETEKAVGTVKAAVEEMTTQVVTWSQAMDAVRKGQGEMSGTIQVGGAQVWDYSKFTGARGGLMSALPNYANSGSSFSGGMNGAGGTVIQNHFDVGTLIGSDDSAMYALARKVGDAQLAMSGRRFSLG